ncbi:hypothetical protein ASG01_04260 [Chryseobacterium sp. Leaf180]|nr:hypothetical protein ASG01_04260 [Chryseobacterium sp. Leaf180]
MYFTQKIKVLDAETQKPVPYAKLILKNQNYKNTEENGDAVLEDSEKISEIQSFGYENLSVENDQTIYYLKPVYKEIAEVQVSRPKFDKTIIIGELKKKTSYGAIKTWMVGKIIVHKSELPQKLFLSKVRFPSFNYNKNDVTINVNIFENKNGLPGELITSKAVICKKGRRITEWTLDRPISFPLEGIIVCFEWIINDQNQYDTEMRYSDGRVKKIKGIYPTLGGSGSSENKDMVTGVLMDGEWKFKTYYNSRSSLSVQLELTD